LVKAEELRARGAAAIVATEKQELVSEIKRLACNPPENRYSKASGLFARSRTVISGGQPNRIGSREHPTPAVV